MNMERFLVNKQMDAARLNSIITFIHVHHLTFNIETCL